jgi:hypothetical protein
MRPSHVIALFAVALARGRRWASVPMVAQPDQFRFATRVSLLVQQIYPALAHIRNPLLVFCSEPSSQRSPKAFRPIQDAQKKIPTVCEDHLSRSINGRAHVPFRLQPRFGVASTSSCHI